MLLGSPTMEDHPVASIEIYTHTNDEFDCGYKLSNIIGSKNISVVIPYKNVTSQEQNSTPHFSPKSALTGLIFYE